MRKLNVILASALLGFSGFAFAQGNGHGNNDDGYPGASCEVGNAVFCEGPQGPKGEQGDRGPVGNDGQDGKDGVDGKDGLDGLDGKDGERGPMGPQGPAGESYDPKFIAELNDRIRENDSNIKAGVAGAYAVSSHQFDVHGNMQLSLSGGYYEGENAVSVAIGGAINEETFINGNITQDSQGNTGAGVGITFQLQ